MSDSQDQQPETIFAQGSIFELVHIQQPDGRVFEVARRAPGVRLIIADKAKKTILLTKEFRSELNDWDYRLPGGKVFNSLLDYGSFRQSGQDIDVPATQKAAEEAEEEAGIIVKGLQLFKKSTLGATVEWDLYIYEAKTWEKSESGQKLEAGEQIESDNWFGYEETKKMIIDGGMKEERIALILLQWINKEEER